MPDFPNWFAGMVTLAALALLWALVPVAAAVLVYRLQRRPTD